MNKKFISSILAGAMALSMAGMNAFAADEAVTAGSDGSYGKEYSVDASMQPVTLDVSIPTTIQVILNPYELETTLMTVDGGSTKIEASVASPVYTIKNKGKTNVSVSITGSIAPKVATNKNLKFLTAKPNPDKPTITKDVFMYVKMGTDKDALVSADVDAKADLILATKDVTKTNYFVIAKKDTADTEAYVKIGGEVNGKADSQWTAEDEVTVTLKFKFEATGKAATT